MSVNEANSSELDLLRQRITELETENFDLKNENQKLRKELESRIEELEKDRANSDAENIKRDAENAELKVRVAKLEQDSSVVDEQSQDAEDGKVFLLRGFKIQRESTAPSVSQNTASLPVAPLVTSHERKNEQGLIQELSGSSTEEGHVTEISANIVRPNQDIIGLYKDACDAETDAIEAIRKEISCWCFYAREFKHV